MDKSPYNDLFARLIYLKSCFRRFQSCRDGDEAQENRALDEMKQAAGSLYVAISAACDSGKIVIISSTHGGGRSHVIRSVGPLNPDFITVKYSSVPKDDRPLYQCVLLSASWIEAVDPAQILQVC